MKSFEVFFSGYVISTLFGYCNLENTSCELVTGGGLKCMNLKSDNFPQDLDKNIKALYIADSLFYSVPENSLKVYKILEMLDLKNTKIEKLNPKFLLSSEYLTSLAFFNCSISRLSQIMFPKRLKNLSFQKMKLTDISFTMASFNNLQVLDFSCDQLKKLPYLGPLNELSILFLDGNPSFEISVEEVAKMCKLRGLYSNESFNNPEVLEKKYCTCVRLRTWMKSFVIGSNIDEKTCPESRNCDVKFSQDIYKKREMCLHPPPSTTVSMEETSSKNFNSMYALLFLLFMSALIILAAISVYTISRIRKPPAAAAEDSENENEEEALSEDE